ncbi:MAG: oxidoreductase [Polyangiaceae bacterium]|nr:oxidoreductase [Polyangiaceae bacterium]
MASSHARVWFITGGSSGLGLALARRALERGDRVVAAARRLEPLAPLCQAFPDEVRALSLDVTEPAQILPAAQRALDAFGRVDVLVNNAGAGVLGALEELDEAQIRRAFEVLFFGPLAVTRALLPAFRRQRRGHIVNMSAIAGFANELGFSAYGGAKFALEGASEALRGELAPLGVHVLVVEPGPFRTQFLSAGFERAPRPIDDYAGTVGAFERFLRQVEGSQPGDPVRAAEAIMLALDAPTPPLRLPLGAYAYQKARQKIAALTAELDAWEAIGRPTDFDDPPAPLRASYRVPVDAPVERLWRLLEDKVENPGPYVPGVTDVRVLARRADGVSRQMCVGAFVLKEDIQIFPAQLVIKFALVDHPLFIGQVMNRVYRPEAGALAELEFTLHWTPRRPLAAAETPDVVALIRHAVQQTKALAEKGD